MKKVAVMYSAGLDSSVLIADLLDQGYDVYPFLFDDDTVEFKNKTLPVAEKFLIHYQLQKKAQYIRLYKTTDIQSNDELGFIPGWKMAMQVAAMAYCQHLGIQTLCLGYNIDNTGSLAYLDDTELSVQHMTDLYKTMYGTSIVVQSPYSRETKTQTVLRGQALGVPFGLTVSCADTNFYGSGHCGTCSRCLKRVLAFNEAGVKDPAFFHQHVSVDPQYLESLGCEVQASSLPCYVLFGGGVDSVSVLSGLTGIEDLALIHFDYGQKAAAREQQAATDTALWLEKNLKIRSRVVFLPLVLHSDAAIMKASDLSTEVPKNNVVLYRNPLMINSAIQYMAHDLSRQGLPLRARLLVGFNGGSLDIMKDCDPTYFSFLRSVAKMTLDMDLSIEAPLSSKKPSEVREELANSYPELLRLSYSCYETEPCGRCPHCLLAKSGDAE